jgi:membrane protein implicated in regulation of membrane protease activity
MVGGPAPVVGAGPPLFRPSPGRRAVAPREHNAVVASQALVGKVGTVITAIRGGEGAGEVRVLVDGLAHYYLAYAATAIAAGTEVLVIFNRGARQIDVEPWPVGEGS